MPSTYIIGDIHGCAQTFDDLLDKLSFRTGEDELFLVGDLVNNGPDSAEVIRVAMQLDATVTLGNHDLHMLAVAHGAAKMRKKDTFQDVLDAPDADELIDWLLHRNLFVRTPDFWMVHAGILPEWSIQQVEAIAQEIEEDLRAGDPASFFEAMYGNEPSLWDDVSTRAERMRIGINAMTRMRALTRDEGRIDFDYKSTLDEMPDRLTPWFAKPHARLEQPQLYFGHWSALGLHRPPKLAITCLDSGCTWGEKLTAIDPHTRQITQVPTRPEEAARR